MTFTTNPVYCIIADKTYTANSYLYNFTNCKHKGVGRNRSSWSGFGQTTTSQGKNKIPFYNKQVINKSARVIFGLVRLVILQYSR